MGGIGERMLVEGGEVVEMVCEVVVDGWRSVGGMSGDVFWKCDAPVAAWAVAVAWWRWERMGRL